MAEDETQLAFQSPAGWESDMKEDETQLAFQSRACRSSIEEDDTQLASQPAANQKLPSQRMKRKLCFSFLLAVSCHRGESTATRISVSCQPRMSFKENEPQLAFRLSSSANLPTRRMKRNALV